VDGEFNIEQNRNLHIAAYGTSTTNKNNGKKSSTYNS
jgi:hypothetical protein